MRNFECPDVDYGVRWVHLQPNNLNHRASEPDYEIGLGVQVYLFNSDLRHNNLLLHGSIPQKQYDRLWVMYGCNKGYFNTNDRRKNITNWLYINSSQWYFFTMLHIHGVRQSCHWKYKSSSMVFKCYMLSGYSNLDNRSCHWKNKQH